MPGRAALLGLMGLQTVFLLIIGLALWSLSGRSTSGFVTFGGDEMLLGLGLAAILVVIGAAGYYGFPRLSDYLVRAQAKTYAFLENPLPLWAIGLVSIGAGVGEEALFRGGVQTLAADYVGMPVAIVIASALFAVVHFAKPLIATIIFVIGAVFGVIYWQTGSLLAVMIAHALYDVFALWYVQKEMHRLGVFAPANHPASQGTGAE